MAARWQAELIADGADPSEAARRAHISVRRITGAPVVILPCLDLATLDVYPDPARQQAEWQMGVQSVALACQNLLLAAQQHGLVGCWMCAPIFCPELVVETLALPETWQPQALLTLGYPRDDAPTTKPRNPLEQHVFCGSHQQRQKKTAPHRWRPPFGSHTSFHRGERCVVPLQLYHNGKRGFVAFETLAPAVHEC